MQNVSEMIESKYKFLSKTNWAWYTDGKWFYYRNVLEMILL